MTIIKLFSALYGGYDDVPAIPEDLNMPAILYTDCPSTKETAYWRGWSEVRLVDHHILTRHGAPHVVRPMLAHKWWKVFAGFDECDVTVWMDASMTITTPRQFREQVEQALGSYDLALMAHPWRNCVYEEAEYSATLHRYDSLAKNLLEQAAYYRSIGHPAHAGLYASGFFVRDNAFTRDLMKDWWWEIITRTHQDQVSLPVVLRLHPEVNHVVNIPWHDGEGSWTHLGFHLK